MERNDQDGFDVFESGGKQPLSRKNRLLIGAAAVVLILALGFASPALLEMLHNNNGGLPQTQDTQATDTDMKSKTLSLEMPVSRYGMHMSSVPGMPFRAICPSADEIRFETDAGVWLEYGAPDYTIIERGTALVSTSGETVYLSPTADDKEYRVTIKAMSGGITLGSAVIILNATDGDLTIENIAVTAYGQ